MATFHGKGGLAYIFVDLPAGVTQWPLSEARSWHIEIDRDFEEEATEAEGPGINQVAWRRLTPLPLFWSGSIAGNMNSLELVSPMDFVVRHHRIPAAMALYPQRSVLGRYYYGAVWPRLSMDVNIDGVARYRLDFDGQGRLYSF